MIRHVSHCTYDTLVVELARVLVCSSPGDDGIVHVGKVDREVGLLTVLLKVKQSKGCSSEHKKFDTAHTNHC